MRVSRGSAGLRELLASRLSDVRELDQRQFAGWLERHLEHWRADPVFAQRSRIRDLRRAHPELRQAEADQRRARAEDEASPLHAQLEALTRERVGADRAVAGLTHVMGRADAAERDALRAKREAFMRRGEELRAEVEALTAASPARLALNRAARRVEELRQRLGLEGEEARLHQLQRSKGRSSGRSGARFEQIALEAVRRELLGELDGSADGGALVVLHGVTLGAARTEIDQLVIRPAARSGPVEVLALVEAKRNINDLVHGLSRRVENLAWLAGRGEGFDAGLYRTAAFPAGAFEGMAVHSHDGRHHRFTRESFRHFLPDSPGPIPERLYLATRPGPLWGLDSGGLARIAHRVSSDEDWNPDDPDYLARLLGWCRDLAGPIEAPDLLRACAADPGASRRVLLLER